MKKRIYKSNGIKASTPADTIPKEDMERLKAYLYSLDLSKPNHLRNYTLLVFNINVGLRAMDLLTLPTSTLIQRGKVVDRFSIYEQKTHKKRHILLNNTAQRVIQTYYDTFKEKLDNSYYLFPSRKQAKTQGEGHLTLSSYDKILREAHWNSGIYEGYTISSHTARKYFGTSLYEAGADINLIQAMYGHSRPETTLIYIAVNKKKAMNLYTLVEN